jgi:hypothetical protein
VIRLFALCALLLACAEDPVSTSSTNNPDVPVALLFTHDGCKVYRFMDNGYHYFARCGLSTSAIGSHLESCGKNCTHRVDEEVPTEEAP